MRPVQARALMKRARNIEGWFDAGGLFALIDEVQRSGGVTGDLFEIGAHHGKSAVMVGQMARADETVGICDLFGDQTMNVSGSGGGNRAIFESNMARLAPGATTRVFECRSDALTVEEVGACRFFHVDGGHLREEALADLNLAAEAVVPGGAIVVDDPYRIEWPGVTEAILAFLHARDPAWVAVVIGFNKLVLTRRADAGPYRDAVESDDVWQFIDARVYERKSLPICRHPASIFYVPTYRQLSDSEAAIARARWAARGARRRLGAVSPHLADLLSGRRST